MPGYEGISCRGTRAGVRGYEGTRVRGYKLPGYEVRGPGYEGISCRGTRRVVRTLVLWYTGISAGVERGAKI